MAWLRTYVAICAGVLTLVVVALILIVTFGDFGLSGHGVAALFIGTLVTVALTMVLMGLIFVSDRGGQDASVYSTHIETDADEPPEAGSDPDNRRSG
ncbi:hypothetical protein [Hypericibacter sp.]|uniref:hypothetical protein n=1 Tax=Hypericibacter sp. TaxID=2705401 RepID=UPI003D6D9E2D